jgi:alkylation response protein AidB-like acyl-CoA dehydrogenase
MDLEYAPRHTQLQAELKQFLADNWPDDDVRGFRTKAIERGFLYRYFPSQYGGSEQPADPIADAIIEVEFTAARAPQGIVGQGPDMVVPTLLQHGTEEQKDEFIASTLVGDITWCQGYSEPSAGSDLASLRSRAEFIDDAWVINGHKIWTSEADKSDWMFGLFRTDPDKPRHRGISFLLVPMDQPGIEVQKLKALTGDYEFCEVFFDDAKTAAKYIVGEPGQGWAVSRSLLVHERNLMGFRSQQLFNSLLDLARSRTINRAPAIDDPAVRRNLVDLEADLMAARYSRFRSLSSATSNNDPNAPLADVVRKLSNTYLTKRLTQAGLDLAGADESLRDPAAGSVELGRANEPGGWMMNFLYTHAIAIGGGAPNIQRNIIGERGLGMPRDLSTPPTTGANQQ